MLDLMLLQFVLFNAKVGIFPHSYVVISSFISLVSLFFIALIPTSLIYTFKFLFCQVSYRYAILLQ